MFVVSRVSQGLVQRWDVWLKLEDVYICEVQILFIDGDSCGLDFYCSTWVRR